MTKFQMTKKTTQQQQQQPNKQRKYIDIQSINTVISIFFQISQTRFHEHSVIRKKMQFGIAELQFTSEFYQKTDLTERKEKMQNTITA